VLVGRRARCCGGKPCRSVADFLLTPISLRPGQASTNWSCCTVPKDGIEIAGLVAGGAARTRRETWFGAG
jgi:hypothetical protein